MLKLKLSSQSASQTAFFEQWNALSHENPLNPRERIVGMAKVELQRGYSPDSVYFDIESMEQGRGHASQALAALCELADKSGVALEVLAMPFGLPGLTAQELVDWYGRHGFVATQKDQARFVEAPDDGLQMVRHPKQGVST